jgi:hypothetical protein
MARNVTPFLVRFVRALISASLIACLTIAPLCAARCATALCVPASPDDSANCHHSSHHTGSAPTFTTHSAALCATAEFIFTTPRPSASSLSIESYIFSIALPDLDVAVRSLAFGLSPSAARTAAERVSPPLPLRL